MRRRDDLREIACQLKRIADALELFLAPEPLIPEPETTGCPHPPEQRVSLGTTNGQEEWACRLCRFRTPIQP